MSARESAPPPHAGEVEDAGTRRCRVRIRGVVQGVGFRPFVYRLARERALAGHVLNDASGVVVEIQGGHSAVESFLGRLSRDAPPLAVIESIRVEELAPRTHSAFRILESDRTESASTLVSPDTATCSDCLAELLDPDDRRYRYPFINCTNCGPRFTIVRGVPYDRALTTMASFPMCAECRTEYEDPADRRFHAQPNACARCGPRVRLVTPDGKDLADAADGVDVAAVVAGVHVADAEDVEDVDPPKCSEPERRDPVELAAIALDEGRIVAVKGLGGYHLACRADLSPSVGRLRALKHREDKPFAVMAPHLDSARSLAELGPEEEALLAGVARPIVLAPRRRDAAVASEVAPGHTDLGIMLPYSPLHHLLLRDVGRPLVMTSGNRSDEPIAYRDRDALERLASIADFFLIHDREIETRTDDSVVRVVEIAGERREMMLRRSRGYVPMPTPLPVPTPAPLLACGGHLKNTFAVAADDHAWVGHHVGDLESYETYAAFREGVDRFETMFHVEPEVVVRDAHPHYLSTRYADERAAGAPSGPAVLRIQHHFAHFAGCLAEHGETGRAVGLIFDGTGHGSDGTVWGGEILVGDLAGFERVGHLRAVRLPGGEAAVREPWRMACAWLVEVAPGADGAAPAIPDPLRGRVDSERWEAVAEVARSGVSAPRTTSMGRLFDAVSALCGIRLEVTYEGQAAIELEMEARKNARLQPDAGTVADPDIGSERDPEVTRYVPEIVEGGTSGALVRLDPACLLRAVVADLAAGTSVPVVAARFHEGLARGAARVACRIARREGAGVVALSGGVFQNVLLLERVSQLLARKGLRPLVPRALPANDGGLSYGQAAAAAAGLTRCAEE